MPLRPKAGAPGPSRAVLRPGAVTSLGREATRWIFALLMFSGCSPADGDRSQPFTEPAVERVPDRPPDARQGSAAGDPVSGVGTAGAGDAQARDRATTATGTADGEKAPAPTCIPPGEPLAGDASLEGRAGEYRLTMVEEVGGSPSRTAEGSLTLLPQMEALRQFAGSAGGSIPGVTSPLFGSTDVNLESVGAVRVGSLSSEDPESPGVLVIESETGANSSILLRLGSDANRRDLVRFDGGYAVLTVVEVTAESFSGTWSSGARGPDSEGFFCATPGR